MPTVPVVIHPPGFFFGVMTPSLTLIGRGDWHMLDLSSVSVVYLSVLVRARVRCMELLTAVAKRSGRTKQRVVLIAINVAGDGKY